MREGRPRETDERDWYTLALVLRPLVLWLVIGSVLSAALWANVFGAAAGAVIGTEAALGVVRFWRLRRRKS